MIRIVVVDDHELIREGVKKIIRSSGDMQLVGEADTLPDAIRAVTESTPDIVILDISIPGHSGLDVLAQLRQRFPAMPLLVLSMYPEERYAIEALKAGAAGYITKGLAVEELIKAIRKITSGGSYITAKIADLLARNVREPERGPAHEGITRREMEIVSLLCAGKQIKQIAAELSISISSVNTYRSRIFRKTGLRSNAALIRYALEHGLLN